MAQVITVASSKGGVGKSTLACNLAVMAAVNKMKTLLVDSDVQGSSVLFRELRAQNPKLIQFPCVSITTETIRQDIKQFSDFDLIIIDAGGRDARTFRGAMAAADWIYIPVLPSPYDLWAAEDTIDIVKEVQSIVPTIAARLVLNQVIANTRLGKEIEEAVAGLGIPMLPAMLSHRQVFKRSIMAGMGAAEADDRDGKAAGEVLELWKETCKCLG